jgi:cytochrome P450
MSITVEDAPALAGARPQTPPRDKREARARARMELFPGLQDEVYRDPIKVSSFFGWQQLIVSDPAAVKRVLVDNVANYPKMELENRAFQVLFGSGLLGIEGELWRTHRRIMAPAFQPSSVASYAPAMTQTSEAFLTRWDGMADGAVVEAADEMNLLALQIISRTMFSTDSDDDLVNLVSSTLGDGALSLNFNILDLMPVIQDIRLRRMQREADAAFAGLNGGIMRMIAAREAAGDTGKEDLLSRLIAAKDEESGAKMSAQEVRDEVITIFMAGHDTTANAMGWTWYLLSQHPREEARLHEELDAVLGGRTPTLDDIPKLAFTRRVVEESMRLYPPAPGISNRVAKSGDELCGQRIKPGASIIIAPWVLHRHRALWDDPERFDPDRFLPERSKGRARFAYLPFGAGPRICIGQLMAMNEVILILATLAQRYRLRLAPEAEVRLVRAITLHPSGLKMRLEKRG